MNSNLMIDFIYSLPAQSVPRHIRKMFHVKHFTGYFILAISAAADYTFSQGELAEAG